MSPRKKNINDLSSFLRYTRNGISGKERNSFERGLQKDPFDAEAAEGLSMVTPREAKEDIESIKRRLSGRKGRKSPVFIMRAAAVAVLLIASALILNLLRKESQEPLLSENITVNKEKNTLPVVASEGIKRAEAVMDKEEPITEAVTMAKKSSYSTGTAKDTVELHAEAEEYVVSDMQIAKLEEKELSNNIIMEQMEKKNRSAVMGKSKRTIEGTVISSEDGLPIPGVSIVIKGTTRGTVSNVDGKFELAAETDSALMLVAQFIGMEPQEVTVKPDSDLLIAMNTSNVSLEEVVVVGYGIERQKSVTGSVSTVKVSEQTNSYDHTNPIPVTGYDSFRTYIRYNLRYPIDETGRKKEIVVIGMTVLKNGTITDIKIIKSPSQLFSEEAIRLIKEGPAWKPATVNSVAQDEEVRVRIVFEE